jgi:hypothetical protein
MQPTLMNLPPGRALGWLELPDDHRASTASDKADEGRPRKGRPTEPTKPKLEKG